MKYNLSEIMHKAWKLYRKGAAAFAECLHRAWNSAKAQPSRPAHRGSPAGRRDHRAGQHLQEFWYARELQAALEYSQWRRFEEAIERAKIACEQSGNPVADHFATSAKWSSWVPAQSEKLTIMFFHGMPAI